MQYANVMGMPKDLNLQGNDFSNVATFTFVALLCFEVPNSKLVPRAIHRPSMHS
jgi:hypothetical protein